ncbi:hypothetical protein FRC12_018399 [Ceratobasidium sp. 428]|nr:hypothetical protein FRC12_018399 [Ceratobasidium sp. 428]
MDFDSHFLAPASSKQPRKSPSRQLLGANGRGGGTLGASLAHELAAAVMSEPSDSRALADELGLEFEDEEEEVEGETLEGLGLDAGLGGGELGGMMMGMNNHSELETPSRPSRNDMLNGHGHGHAHDLDSDFESSPSKPPPPPSFTLSTPSVDPIDTLKENVKFLDRFITQLQHMDIDPSSPTRSSFATTSQARRTSMHGGAEPAVERIATDMIRHIDDARREREDQLRDLMSYEREFRKIDGEPGGADRLGSLEPLEDVSLTDKPAAAAYTPSRALDAVPEDEYDESWEAQRDPRDVFDDDMDEGGDGDDPAFADRSLRQSTTTRAILPAPPAYPSGPLTPSSTLPHLAHMRSISQILATSLSGLSEHVQVNGAAAAEAGRKLRALKNKVGDLQAEWTSAEQSMVRIERSERGLEWEKTQGTETPQGKRVDGRVLVKEIKASFFAQLEQAEMRVQAMFPTVVS